MSYDGYIYKITCTVTGKPYIGKTYDLAQRKAAWFNTKRPYTSPNSKIDLARNKYGVAAFTHEIIESYLACDDLVFLSKTLRDRERYFISYYDSVKNGYNITEGGEGLLGVKRDYRIHPKSQACLVYRISDGSFVGSFGSLRAAGRAIGAPVTWISRNLNGNSHSVSGCIVLPADFSGDLDDRLELAFLHSAHHGDIIYHYNWLGQRIGTYAGILDASCSLSVPRTVIKDVLHFTTTLGDGSKCIYGDGSCYGSILLYAYRVKQLMRILDLCLISNNRIRPVCVFVSGDVQYYPSLHHASVALGVSSDDLHLLVGGGSLFSDMFVSYLDKSAYINLILERGGLHGEQATIA